MKKFLAIALTAALLFNTQSLVYAEETTENGDEAATEYVSGYIQSDLDYNTPVYENEIALYSDVPSSYGSIAEVRSTYPENRNQNPYGTCWAFSSIGLAEFDLINDGMADKNIDLSELQLAYFTFNSVTDPLGGTEGDSAKYYNENASNNYLNYGGNYEMASRRLAQWVGVVKESDVPYSTAGSVLTGGVSDEYAYNADVTHLRNAYLINIKQNPTDVKRQIMEHGAVGVMYYHDDFNLSTGPNGNEYNYYDTSSSGGGHAVMVVGWDDNYSKDNFIWKQPTGNGAWLIRNSWGSYVDYFWMSYETFSLSDTAWVFDFIANDGFDNNYQLDGGLETVANKQYTTMANVFTAKTDADVKSETLKAVSVSFTHNASVNYTIEVYTDLTDVKNPTSGTKQGSATTQGTTAYAGIYTIELADEVEIQPGSSFAIVVSTNNKCALEYEQAMTIATGDNLETIVWDCTVSLNNQKTFYKSGSRFYAWPWGNLCVKAFTSDNKYGTPDTPVTPVEKTYTITYNLDGGTNNSSNPSTYKTGNSTITLKAPTKSGYTFAGWYTDSAYTNRITEIPANSTTNYTLYAKWTQNLAEITNWAEGVYIIKSAINNNLVFDIAANSSDDGANVAVWNSNGLACQRYNFVKRNGSYTITAMNSNKNLDLQSASYNSGTNVLQKQVGNTTGQEWKLYDAGNGCVYIKSVYNGLYLTLDKNKAGGNISVCTYTGDSNQKFVLERDSSYDSKDDSSLSKISVSTGVYKIESGQNASLVFDIAGNSGEDGANLAVWNSNDLTCQRYNINQHNGAYTMTALNSMKNIDVAGAATASGTNVQQWSANGCNAQDWEFYDAGSGYVYIKSVCSGLYLTLDSNNAGGNICIRPYTAGNNQKFKLQRDSSYDGINESELTEVSIIAGQYEIESALDSSWVFDIAGNSADAGANLEVWYRNNLSCQRFTIASSNGAYTMTAMNSGKNVDVAGASNISGTNVQQWDANGCNAQEWKFYDAGNGYVYIKSMCSGLYLTTDGNNAGANICIRTYTGNADQKFKLNAYSTPSDADMQKNIAEGTYRIAAFSDSSLVIDIAANSNANGANVGFWYANGLACQEFEVKYCGNGYYSIQPQNSKLYLDVAAASSAVGTNVQQWEWTNCDAQLWHFIDAGNGAYYIQSKCNGLYLGTQNGAFAGANIAVYDNNNSNNCKFVLVKTN